MIYDISMLSHKNGWNSREINWDWDTSFIKVDSSQKLWGRRETLLVMSPYVTYIKLTKIHVDNIQRQKAGFETRIFH